MSGGQGRNRSRTGRRPSGQHGPDRLWEVDALRGLAIALMVIYHAVWDLTFTGFTTVDLESLGWVVVLRKSGAALFLLLVGVSLVLERSRFVRRTGGTWNPWPRAWGRGTKILAWGLVITLVTRFAIPDAYIRFGILHLIGVAVILSPLFVPLGGWGAPVGVAVIAIGLFLGRLDATFIWGIPLGLAPHRVGMVDYYPVLPWIGVVLIGVAVGAWLYPGGERRYAVPAARTRTLFGLAALGRHTLLIYLVHQPVLLGLFFVIRRATL